eukprot:GHVR01019387.1.p1 GENE.GHVR01019387.1~~GHVR01019387.1.p1  ORF type:complete len:142 (-),score=41.64 GHVR01019387.1:41-466(-)
MDIYTTLESYVRFITKDGIIALKKHKYVVGSGYTICYRLLNPYWNFCSQLLPKSIAPTVVTAVAFICSVLMGVLVVSCYSFHDRQNNPGTNSFSSRVSLTCGILYFIYQTLDALDFSSCVSPTHTHTHIRTHTHTHYMYIG